MKYKFESVLFLSFLLAACGGGGSNSSSSTTQVTPPAPPNTAPMAVPDSAVTQDDSPVEVSVLDNDTDVDNDNLSISEIVVQPTNGNVAINGETITYTPNALFAGTDTFTYMISDGEDTSQAEVVVTSTQTLVLSGIITDSPIANATVTLSLADQIFLTQADEQGTYTLPVVINSPVSGLLISATGAEENNQTNVELLSFIGSSTELLGRIDSTRTVDNSVNTPTNATQISTARTLLVQQQNNGVLPEDFSTFQALSSDLNATALLELAAIINLLIDNDEFPIPEGETILSLLQSREDSTLEQNIDAYLTRVGAIDENGERTSSFEAALGTAIENTLSNGDAIARFTDADVQNQTLISFFGNVRDGFLPNVGGEYDFNADGRVVINTRTFATNAVTTNFEDRVFDGQWTVNDRGELVLEFGDLNIVTSEFDNFLTFDDISARFGEVAAELARSRGFFNTVNGLALEIEERILQQTLTPIAISTDGFQAHSSSTRIEMLVVGVGRDTRLNAMPVSIPALETTNVNETVNLHPSKPSLFLNETMQSLAGQWAIPILYEFLPELDGEVVENDNDGLFQQEIIRINEDGTGNAEFSQQNVIWQLNEDGVLILQIANEEYRITPIMSNGIEFLARIERRVDDGTQELIIRRIARFSENVATADDLVSELPVITADLGFGGFDNANYNRDVYVGPIGQSRQLNADGSHRIIVSRSQGGERFYENAFVTENDTLAPFWEGSGRSTSLRFGTILRGFNAFERTEWRHIGTDDNGRTLVVEYRVAFLDVDRNDVFNDGDITFFVGSPNIDILVTLDLSLDEVGFANTLERGSLPLP